MFAKPRKINQYRRKCKNLIATNKIKPEQWDISNTEARKALKAKGYDIKQIKKIHRLKHQLCISYWDAKERQRVQQLFQLPDFCALARRSREVNLCLSNPERMGEAKLRDEVRICLLPLSQ